MPIINVKCLDCGWPDEDIVANTSDTPRRCIRCGGLNQKQFSPTTVLRLAPYMRREAEDGRARHRAWMEKPEVQAKLRSGEFEVDAAPKRDDSIDGDAASSSVISRSENGYRV